MILADLADEVEFRLIDLDVNDAIREVDYKTTSIMRDGCRYCYQKLEDGSWTHKPEAGWLLSRKVTVISEPVKAEIQQSPPEYFFSRSWPNGVTALINAKVWEGFELVDTKPAGDQVDVLMIRY